MENKMNKGLKIWLVMVTLIVVGILAAFWAAATFNRPRGFTTPLPPGPDGVIFVAGDIEFFYIAKSVVSMINIALLIVLIINYASIYMKTRSEFTIGLLIFAVVFFLKDLASNPFVIGAFGFLLIGLGPFALLPD